MDHNTFKNEAEKLKYIISNGNLHIPSFWECVWPGVLMIFWIVICPVIAFQMYIEMYSGDPMIIASGVFVGMLFTVAIFNIRSWYLAIPYEFRVNSIFFKKLKSKLVAYYLVYMLVVPIASYFSTYTTVEAAFYAGPLLISLLLIMFIGLMDISRYRVSAFSSVLELIKSRKQGGE